MRLKEARSIAAALVMYAATALGQTTPPPDTNTANTAQDTNPSAPAANAPSVPEANPGRPTVATPATLTPVGYLQFETGVLYATGADEFSSQVGINQVTKLAVHPRLQLIVQSQPVAFSRVSGTHDTDPGDVMLGLQGVVLQGNESGKPTVALSYFKHAYAGSAPGIDIGTAENSVLLLVSGDVRGFHYDSNAMFNEQKDGPLRRGQFGQTISVSHKLGPFTVAGELWHFTQPLTHGNAVGNLWAVSYPLRRNLVVDAGFDHGLTSTSTQWEGFAGFTYLLPHRLWGRAEKK